MYDFLLVRYCNYYYYYYYYKCQDYSDTIALPCTVCELFDIE